jgi:hypothetical protein
VAGLETELFSTSKAAAVELSTPPLIATAMVMEIDSLNHWFIESLSHRVIESTNSQLQPQENRNPEIEIRKSKLENGNWKPENRNSKIDTGKWKLENGNSKFENRSSP